MLRSPGRPHAWACRPVRTIPRVNGRMGGGLLVQAWGRRTGSYGGAFRDVAQGLLGLGGLLGREGQTAPYYAVAFIVSLNSYLSPVL